MASANSETPAPIFSFWQAYEAAIADLETEQPAPTREQILAVLVARDAIQTHCQENTSLSAEALLQLAELDDRLKRQVNVIVRQGDLANWRASFQPPPSAWWWYLEAPAMVDRDDQLDWLWNGLAIICLTGFVTHFVTFIPLLLGSGLGALESLGILGPSGLLVVAISSLRGGEGQKLIQSTLKRTKIPPKYYSEATFGLSLLLMLLAIQCYYSKPKLADSYYRRALRLQSQGLIKEAQKELQRAQGFYPDNPDIAIALGMTHESLGNNNQAKPLYQQALASGNPLAFNNLGRIYLQEESFDQANTLLLMGLQRAQNPDEQFQLTRNLGWTALEQENYPRAQTYLQAALHLDRKQADTNIGSGMAHCFLAQAFVETNQPQKAALEWQNCQQFARPEILAEYRWLVRVGRYDIASKIDTSGMIGL
ncbi:tetratricopeptide repeat protein [Trichothermofontia sp.]